MADPVPPATSPAAAPSGEPPAAATPATPPDPLAEPLRADIGKLIEKARADEKAKMYSQLETAKAERTAALAQAQQLSDAMKALQSAPAAAPATAPATAPVAQLGTISTADFDRAVKAAVDSTLQRAKTTLFEPQLAALAKRLEETSAALAKRELDDYRRSLIEENKDVIIPELVTGMTRDEVDQSLVAAKQVFAKVTERFTQAVAARGGTIPPVPGLTNGTQTITPAGSGSLLDRAGSMSDADFAKQRDEILRLAAEQAQAALKAQEA